jgi:hypothetical protein
MGVPLRVGLFAVSFIPFHYIKGCRYHPSRVPREFFLIHGICNYLIINQAKKRFKKGFKKIRKAKKKYYFCTRNQQQVVCKTKQSSLKY